MLLKKMTEWQWRILCGRKPAKVWSQAGLISEQKSIKKLKQSKLPNVKPRTIDKLEFAHKW